MLHITVVSFFVAHVFFSWAILSYWEVGVLLSAYVSESLLRLELFNAGVVRPAGFSFVGGVVMILSVNHDVADCISAGPAH